jgi:hypothetical protein
MNDPNGDGARFAVPETASRMTAAASGFLAALTAEQRQAAWRGFGDDAQRKDWSFLPAPQRSGLQFGDLGDGQRKLAHELIVAGTSMRGYAKVVSVMAMEHVLRALATASRPRVAHLFDPGRYCVRIFGEPGRDEPWGWQIAGHHVSLNFTVVAGRHVSPTPCMLGAEPASYGVLAPLADDEEAGYRFVNSLGGAERRAAIIHHRPPPDLATRMVAKIGDTERPDPVFPPEPEYVLSENERNLLSYVRTTPKGLEGRQLTKQQLTELAAVVEAFARRLPDDVAAAEMSRIEQAGLENLTFAWAGATDPGQRHYFRIQGPTLLIEHDNTQDNGNHIHSVWRDPVNDFGDDLLAEHYRVHHAPAEGLGTNAGFLSRRSRPASRMTSRVTRCLAATAVCGVVVLAATACTGGGRNDHGAQGHVPAAAAIGRPQAASLVLPAGRSSAQYRIAAPAPAQYGFDVTVTAPASADVSVNARTWYGATLGILVSTRDLQGSCTRKNSQDVCSERFPLLPAQRAGIWTIVAAKRSMPAATVRIAITFAKP